MERNNIAGRREASDWVEANANNLEPKQVLNLLHNLICLHQRVQKRLRIEATIVEYTRILNEIDGK